jgi:hypothetical protein
MHGGIIPPQYLHDLWNELVARLCITWNELVERLCKHGMSWWNEWVERVCHRTSWTIFMGTGSCYRYSYIPAFVYYQNH